jgi:hypothetical protein
MGKTSLARAVLHHTAIIAKYDGHRYFVACDTAASKIELAGIIGAHIGLKPGKDLTHTVVQHFSRGPPCLLVLDNLETLWEPTELRNETEELLSLLTDVDHVSLIVAIILIPPMH